MIHNACGSAWIGRLASALRAAGAVGLGLLALVSAAQASGDPPNLVIQSLGASMSRGVVTYPLRAGVFQTKLAPAYLVLDHNGGDDFNSLKGWGLATAMTYGLSDHWGVGVLAGYNNISGDHTLNFHVPDGRVIAPAKVGSRDRLSSAGHGHGLTFNAAAIFDPLSGDGLRLPVYAGGGVMSIFEQADNAGLGVKRVADNTSPSLFAGVAPSVNIWKFRAVGYLMIAAAVDAGNGEIIDYDPVNGTVNSKTSFPLEGGLGASYPVGGIELTYQPWGLGFAYTPDIDGEGAQSYGLQWVYQWGSKSK